MIRCQLVIVARSGQIVVDRLSLDVAAGETLAVIGRLGAGKSSLLAAIATAIPVHGGDITIDGRSVRHDPGAARRSIGYVPPHLPAPQGMRAREFLELFAAAAGLTGGSSRSAVERGLASAGMSDGADERIDRLPEGRWRLLLVARALLHSPDVLLVDDPFGGLDPTGRREVERLIEDLRLGGRTVVAAIDDGRVPDCFSSVAVLREGRLRLHTAADPAVVASESTWRYRIHCRSRAEDAAATITGLVDRVEVIDAHTIECLLAPTGSPIADVIATLVAAGVAITSAALHPSWSEQLVDRLA